MMHHGEFVMFFGVETIELAQAARGRLQRANFAVCFWTTEEGLFVAAKVLERIENVERIENEDVQVGPFMRLMEGHDGSEQVETIDWREIPKNPKYRN
jgi:hypothetical protein